MQSEYSFNIIYIFSIIVKSHIVISNRDDYSLKKPPETVACSILQLKTAYLKLSIALFNVSICLLILVAF